MDLDFETRERVPECWECALKWRWAGSTEAVREYPTCTISPRAPSPFFRKHWTRPFQNPVAPWSWGGVGIRESCSKIVMELHGKLLVDLWERKRAKVITQRKVKAGKPWQNRAHQKIHMHSVLCPYALVRRGKVPGSHDLVLSPVPSSNEDP